MFKRIHIAGIVIVCMMTVNFFSCSKDEAPLLPVISSFFPATATTDDPVKIIGQNFSTATSLSFGSAAAKSFKIISDSVIFAYVGTGASGNISVVTSKGTTQLAGFTYYVPQTFNMTGSCLYEQLGWPIIPGFGVSKAGTDNGSITILKLNKYDSARNEFDDYHPPNPYSISPFADSTDYVRLCGMVTDPGPFVGSFYVSFNGSSKLVVYAKIVGTVVTVPQQFIGYQTSNIVSGKGSLVNGKLTVEYRFQYRGNIKTSTLVSN